MCFHAKYGHKNPLQQQHEVKEIIICEIVLWKVIKCCWGFTKISYDWWLPSLSGNFEKKKKKKKKKKFSVLKHSKTESGSYWTNTQVAPQGNCLGYNNLGWDQ